MIFLRPTALFAALLFICQAARPATVLVLEFQNKSPYSDLNWVGESIADTLMTEFAGANVIVPSRSERSESERRLSLREGADYTKATLIRLGESFDADTICFGSFSISLPKPDAQLKDSSIRITAEFMDLRHMHLGPEESEAGPLSELSRLEEHLAFSSLHYLEPELNLKLEQFLSPQKIVRLEAIESYTRGLLSTNRDQRQKWFIQAATIDSKFPGPALELGKLALEQKQYAQVIQWLQHVNSTDPNYPEARFKMGIASYDTGDFQAASGYFKEVASAFPLGEVYNNLGVADDQINAAAALQDFKHALDSDPHNLIYLFNSGLAQFKAGSSSDAQRTFEQLLQHSDDAEARTLLDQARQGKAASTVAKLPAFRLKNSFNETAFRQLKAMIQPKVGVNPQ